jgi:hypothetical protein
MTVNALEWSKEAIWARPKNNVKEKSKNSVVT